MGTTNLLEIFADTASPLEERHVDFILEEEFAFNPDFLRYFVDHAWAASGVEQPYLLPNELKEVKCFRSVTTHEGESDVLVVYWNSADEAVAILIEDKIGAGFQENQADRYFQRGENGVQAGKWQHHWNCLVAPASYSMGSHGFRTRLNIELIAAFFEQASDPRSQFKAQVLRAAANKTSIPGVKHPDATMTEFRRQYSDLATQLLREGQWHPEIKGPAFTGDSWFRYLHPALGPSVQCIHKPLAGCVQLIFPLQAKSVLESLMEQPPEAFNICPVGKKGIALEVKVRKLSGNHSFQQTDDIVTIVAEVAGAISKLNEFMLSNQKVLQQFGIGPVSSHAADNDDEDGRLLRSLEAQLFGLMWARAVEFRSPAGFEYPDLNDLYAGKQESKFIKIPRMAGGFEIIFRRGSDGRPVLFTESISRTSDGGMFNEIRFGEMHSAQDDLYDSPSLQEWAEERLRSARPS
jgi:hypothetical protein